MDASQCSDDGVRAPVEQWHGTVSRAEYDAARRLRRLGALVVTEGYANSGAEVGVDTQTAAQDLIRRRAGVARVSVCMGPREAPFPGGPAEEPSAVSDVADRGCEGWWGWQGAIGHRICPERRKPAPAKRRATQIIF